MSGWWVVETGVWVPAFAGMTVGWNGLREIPRDPLSPEVFLYGWD